MSFYGAEPPADIAKSACDCPIGKLGVHP